MSTTMTNPQDTYDTSRFTIIRASAGSGKTYRLMEILAERLSDPDDGLEPSQIIATTFTRKAAGELSQRIQQRLLNEASKADKANKTRLQQQILALPSALIGTVNSITDHLLRRYAVDAGMSPELSILSEETEQRAFDTATAPIISRYQRQYSNLLSRMEYDDLPGRTSFGKSRVWSDEVKAIVTKARAENLSPAEVSALAAHSQDALADALGPTATSHLRESAWQSMQLASQLVAEKYKPSGNNARNLVDLKEQLDTKLPRLQVNSPDEPWRTWMSLCSDKRTMFGKNPPAFIKKAIDGIMDGVIAYEDAEFRADVDQLIAITFEAAAECMQQYADYKRALSQIDFVDQERLALELISTNPRVQRELQEQFKVLIVDEFQDTSPIQLAFFMELSKYVEQVIWVGDPKQSIYGFRGADPQLMGAAVDALIHDQDDDANVLKHSWRTHEVPLELSNHLFAPLFPNDVAATLSIPEAKREEHTGGSIQWWSPGATPGNTRMKFKNEDTYRAIAYGLHTAISVDGPLERGRAVLTRTNSQAQEIIEFLNDFGIDCEGTASPVIDTREGTAVAAGLSLLLDPTDTQALLELVTILDDHPAHTNWFEQLTSTDKKGRNKLFQAWRNDESLAALFDARGATGAMGLAELVSTVITALGLPRRIRHWSQPKQRMTNLQSLCEIAEEYASTVSGEAAAFSITEFLHYLQGTFFEEGPHARAAARSDAVKVMTIWKAKGLEWDSVIIPRCSVEKAHSPVGLWVNPAEEFDVFNPLSGRTLYYWPATLLTAKAGPELLDTSLQQTQVEADAEEKKRVLYVALTRSRQETIIASHHSVQKSLAPIATNRALKLADNDGLVAVISIPEGQLGEPQDNTMLIHNPHQVIDGATGGPRTCPGCEKCLRAELDITQFWWPVEPPEETSPKELSEPEEPLAWIFGDGSEAVTQHREFPAARFVPSQALAPETPAAVKKVATIGKVLVEKGAAGWDAVGDAVHGYLGVNTTALDAQTREDLAADLLRRWRVEEQLTPEQLLAAGEAWNQWVTQRFGDDAEVRTEVPFAFRGDGGAHAQGWMDAIVVDADGTWFIVDHKTYPGSEPEQHIRDNYLGQMATYQAAARAAGHRLGGLFIHMSLRGEVYEVSLSD